MGNQNSESRDKSAYSGIDHKGEPWVSQQLPEQTKEEVEKQIQALSQRLNEVNDLIEKEVKQAHPEWEQTLTVTSGAGGPKYLG